jgi:M6 family metalloprotease-like protein
VVQSIVWPLSALALASASIEAGPRVCTPPTGRPWPQGVIDATALDDGPLRPREAYAPWAEQLRANRRDLAAGRISPALAEARGGTIVSGTRKVPIFLSTFANTGADPFPAGDLQTELFDGPWPTGTMTEYYTEISYGSLALTGQVFDWVTLAENDTYYEGNMNGFPGMGSTAKLDEYLLETLDANDPAIDFGQFDNDGPDGNPNSGDDDGVADFVAFVHPELGGECDAGDNGNIWSHRWVYSGWTGAAYETNDARSGGGFIQVNDYVIQPAISCDGPMIEIGVFCHEFGHTFGIVDLYDTTPNGDPDSEGVGHWCLMGAGSWNTPERPGHMSAWAKERLGWVNYFTVTQDLEQLCLPPIETNPIAVRLWAQGGDSPEYFVVENRQAIGFDESLTAEGLVIYHIDETTYDAQQNLNRVNGDESHKAIDVECADAGTASHVIDADDLDTLANRSDAGDVWCPATQVTFDGASTPDTRAYSDAPTGVAVRNIASCGPNICAEYEVGTPRTADLCIRDCEGGDCDEITSCSWFWGSPEIWIDNDDDGVQDLPAETVANHLYCRVENVGPEPLGGVSVDLYYGDPAMGQLWPSTGNLIGTFDVPMIDVGQKREGFVEFVYPEPPEFVEHYCIGAIARHPLDPQNAEYAPYDNGVAQVNHQVLVDRAGTGRIAGGDAASGGGGCPGSFTKSSRIYLGEGWNPEHETVVGKVLVGSPPDFNDAVLPAGWSLDISPGTGPFAIAPGGRDSIFVKVSTSAANHGDRALVPLTFWDDRHNRAIGGVILEYRVDCFDPIAPPNATAEWLALPPDDLSGPTVKVEWDKVVTDETGGPELVKRYDVYRSFTPEGGSQGPETLVDRVALDGDPNAPGFQWFDGLATRCEGLYSYRVRAVDAAGVAGSYSDPYDLPCESVVETEDPGFAARTAWSWARPNPFNPSTTLFFRIPGEGRVDVEIFDSSGHLVRALVDRVYAAGVHEARWDGRDDAGRPLASGVYWYRIRGPSLADTRKLVLTK